MGRDNRHAFSSSQHILHLFSCSVWQLLIICYVWMISQLGYRDGAYTSEHSHPGVPAIKVENTLNGDGELNPGILQAGAGSPPFLHSTLVAAPQALFPPSVPALIGSRYPSLSIEPSPDRIADSINN